MKTAVKISIFVLTLAVFAGALPRRAARAQTAPAARGRAESVRQPNGTQQDPAAANADAPVVTARFVPDSVLIGDQYWLEVQIEKDIMQVVEFPDFPSGTIAGDMEILQETQTDTLLRDGRTVTIGKKYLLTCFEPGIYRTYPFPMMYVDKNIIDTIWSADSLEMVVQTFQIDTLTQTIHDIKLPMKAPVRFGEFGGYLLFAWMIAVFVVALRMALRNREGVHALRRAPVADRPPHEIAIAKLEELDSHKLWQSGRFKQYYTGVTDILREYIELRYGVQAMEMTSSDILGSVKEPVGDTVAMGRLSDVMLTADLVKFAKYTPDAEKNEKIYFEAYYFIEETRELPAGAIPEEGGGGDEG